MSQLMATETYQMRHPCHRYGSPRDGHGPRIICVISLVSSIRFFPGHGQRNDNSHRTGSFQSQPTEEKTQGSGTKDRNPRFEIQRFPCIGPRCLPTQGTSSKFQEVGPSHSIGRHSIHTNPGLRTTPSGEHQPRSLLTSAI